MTPRPGLSPVFAAAVTAALLAIPTVTGTAAAADHPPGEKVNGQPAAAANAVGPGGEFPFRSHGLAIVNADSTARSRAARCSGVRTTAPAPAGASRWETRSAPAGEWTSRVPVPRRCRSVRGVPARPGGVE